MSLNFFKTYYRIVKTLWLFHQFVIYLCVIKDEYIHGRNIKSVCCLCVLLIDYWIVFVNSNQRINQHTVSIISPAWTNFTEHGIHWKVDSLLILSRNSLHLWTSKSLTLPKVSYTQSTYSKPIYLISVLILFFHLCLGVHSVLFPWRTAFRPQFYNIIFSYPICVLQDVPIAFSSI
jgi:hypothetical protein